MAASHWPVFGGKNRVLSLVQFWREKLRLLIGWLDRKWILWKVLESTRIQTITRLGDHKAAIDLARFWRGNEELPLVDRGGNGIFRRF